MPANITLETGSPDELLKGAAKAGDKADPKKPADKKSEKK